MDGLVNRREGADSLEITWSIAKYILMYNNIIFGGEKASPNEYDIAKVLRFFPSSSH